MPKCTTRTSACVAVFTQESHRRALITQGLCWWDKLLPRGVSGAPILNSHHMSHISPSSIRSPNEENPRYTPRRRCAGRSGPVRFGCRLGNRKLEPGLCRGCRMVAALHSEELTETALPNGGCRIPTPTVLHSAVPTGSPAQSATRSPTPERACRSSSLGRSSSPAGPARRPVPPSRCPRRPL